MRLSVVTLAALAATADATQDSAYYPGFNNPNVRKNKMYYREAINVLQDIDAGKFSALFVQYHGCVWSEYGTSGEEGVCADGGAKMYQVNNNQNRYYGNNYKEPWYQGNTQCFRANAAYSLYGIPTGKSSSEGCTEKHYINSFFTSYGIESFAEPLGIDYSTPGASSMCVSKRYKDEGDDKDDEDGENNNNNQNNNNGGGYGQYHGEITLNDYVSYTTGCSRQGTGFVKAMYRGAYCDGDNYLSATNQLRDFNSGLESMGCMQVYSDDYDAQKTYTANNLQYNNNGFVAEANGEKSMAFQLLAYSSSCSVVEYPGRCPDPYGLKEAQDMRLYQKGQANQRAVPIIMPITSTALFFGAVVLFFMSCMIRGRTATMVENRKKAIREKRKADYAKEEYPSNLGATLRLFARSTSGLSTASVSVMERLRAYAEEEIDEESSESEESGDESDDEPRERAWDEKPGAHIQLPPSIDSTDKKDPMEPPAFLPPILKSSLSKDDPPNTASGEADAFAKSRSVSFEDDSPVMVERPSMLASTSSLSMPNAEGGILIGQVDVLADQSDAIASMSRSRSHQSSVDPPIVQTASTASSVKSSSALQINASKSNQESGSDGSDGSAVMVEAPVDESSKNEAIDNAEVADALLAERGIIPAPSAGKSTSINNNATESKSKKSKKKYKRPMLASMSKFLFRKKKKAPVKSITTTNV